MIYRAQNLILMCSEMWARRILSVLAGLRASRPEAAGERATMPVLRSQVTLLWPVSDRAHQTAARELGTVPSTSLRVRRGLSPIPTERIPLSRPSRAIREQTRPQVSNPAVLAGPTRPVRSRRRSPNRASTMTVGPQHSVTPNSSENLLVRKRVCSERVQSSIVSPESRGGLNGRERLLAHFDNRRRSDVYWRGL